LSFVYISQGFTIDPHRQIIQRGDEKIQVRPKTFALLLLLLEKPRELLSKRYLIDTIWDDVTVEEQGLVQSIRELRQLFGNAEIIQTYPRKGYAWAASVQQQLQDEQPQIALQTPFWRRAYTFIAIVMALLAVVAITLYTYTNHKNEAKSGADVVIVLPVNSQIPGSDHNWVPLGAMDQLIKLLMSDRHVQVMDTQYVLNLMHNIDLPRAYNTAQVARLFNASGATVIVETQLSGSVENYRLDYKLHFKNDIKRGALFEINLNDLLRNLALTIASHTGQSLTPANVNSTTAFGNELIAHALEKLDAGELDLAHSLLLSMKRLEPDNVVARHLLAGVLVQQRKTDAAIEEILSAIDVAQARDSARLQFLLAQAKAQQDSIDDALVALEQAHKFAARNNDVLYQGYIAQLRGDILQKRGSFADAEASFKDAIKYHSIIRCPIGVTLTRLQLLGLYSAQNKMDLARNQYNQAKELVEAHDLHYLLPELEAANAYIAIN
jgi:DNA-binding winged helix-turn-helix (wHTH) protein